jgi:hypothetical protein
VPGGRVELPTPAFSGPRSTGELPRHKGRQKILRVQEVRSKGKKMEEDGGSENFLTLARSNFEGGGKEVRPSGRTRSIWMRKAFRPWSFRG